jgi:hypothetical protein
MTVARKYIVNLQDTAWYHCISGCVQQKRLLNNNGFDRKGWVELRTQELASIFAIDVAGHAVLDSHMHFVLRIDEAKGKGFTNEEVVRRWGELYPPRNRRGEILEITDDWVSQKASEADWVKERRRRLMDLGWFHKCLKEPLSRLINKIDGTRGTIFASRYKSIGILDDASLLRVMAYVDLNPVAAGVAKLPETSLYTSIRQRVDNVLREMRLSDLKSVIKAMGVTTIKLASLETKCWLMPIEDSADFKEIRKGIIDRITVGHYFLLVDLTGRYFREGKASIDGEAACIFERLEMTAEEWISQQERLSSHRTFGQYYSTSIKRLQKIAERRGNARVINASGKIMRREQEPPPS